MDPELKEAALEAAQMAREVADSTKDKDVRALALSVFRISLALQHRSESLLSSIPANQELQPHKKGPGISVQKAGKADAGEE